MTYKIGTIGEFRQWSREVIRDPAAAEGVPKRWFDSEETARAVDDVSAEAVVKLLSPENVMLLQVIGREQPPSVQRLAELVGRKQSNISRTLKKLEKAGIVCLEPVMDLVGEFYLLRVLGIDRDLTEILGCCA